MKIIVDAFGGDNAPVEVLRRLLRNPTILRSFSAAKSRKSAGQPGRTGSLWTA